MKLMGKLFTGAADFIRDINPSTLSGAIDVIVVKQEDGSFRCSPFHVRFGKLQILRSKEKVVDITLNDNLLQHIHMKLGDAGDAFFVVPVHEEIPKSGSIPAHLITSPLPDHFEEPIDVDISEMEPISIGEPVIATPTFNEEEEFDVHAMQRIAVGDVDNDVNVNLREDDGDDTMFPWEQPINIASSAPERPSILSSDRQRSVSESTIDFDPSAKRRDTKSYNKGLSWEWGEPPELQNMVASSPPMTPFTAPISPIQMMRSSSFSPYRSVSHPTSLNRSVSESSGVDGSIRGDIAPPPSLESNLSVFGDHHYANVGADGLHANALSTLNSGAEVISGSGTSQSGSWVGNIFRMFRASKSDDGLDHRYANSHAEVNGGPDSHGSVVNKGPQHLATSITKALMEQEKTRPFSDDIESTAIVDATTGLLQEHAGPAASVADSIDLDVNSVSSHESSSERRNCSFEDNVPRRRCQRNESTTANDNVIELSLCGANGLYTADTDDNDFDDNFQQHRVSWEEFGLNPFSITTNPNLVICVDDQYLSGHVALPVLLARLAYSRTLPDVALKMLVRTDPALMLPKDDNSSQFLSNSAIRSKKHERKSPNKSVDFIGCSENTDSLIDSNVKADVKTSQGARKNSVASRLSIDGDYEETYCKTLRLTSEQLASLNLKPGANNVSFSVHTTLQGTATCFGTIYLWNWYDKIVISDIDGTITRSDTLGHILPALVGKDWTQGGVANLFSKVKANGYQMLFLSSRAIGQANITREFLKGVRQGERALPEGPVLLSPDRLITSFHREVIRRKPEEFKIACLRDVHDLWPSHCKPFYAGFGNRATDALSYAAVGVPPSRTFTINTKGDIKVEASGVLTSSYTSLATMVDHAFPPRAVDTTGNSIHRLQDNWNEDSFNEFQYWKLPMPILDDNMIGSIEDSKAVPVTSDNTSEEIVKVKENLVGEDIIASDSLPTDIIDETTQN